MSSNIGPGSYTKLRTLQISGTNSSKTLYSILASASGGAGSEIRQFNYYKSIGYTTDQYFQQILGITVAPAGSNQQLALMQFGR